MRHDSSGVDADATTTRANEVILGVDMTQDAAAVVVGRRDPDGAVTITEVTVVAADAAICELCAIRKAVENCCSSHNKHLCHGCYRRSHFVGICYEGCPQCAAEDLPLIYPPLRTEADHDR